MYAFDLVGAGGPVVTPPKSHVRPAIVSLIAGFFGSLLWRRHPVLGFLHAVALADNGQALAAGERTWKQAAEDIGKHVVATAGSLALPTHPAIGYVAAAVAADLLVDGKGGGVFERMAKHSGFEDVIQETVHVGPVRMESKAPLPGQVAV